MGCNRCGPCGVMLAFLLLSLVTATNILSWFPQWRQFRVFNITSGAVWDSYKLDVVQIDWIFYIHICVYNLQFICLLYSCIAALCRSRCVKPPGQQLLQQPAALVSYCLGLCGVVGWLSVRSISSISAYSIIGISAAAICFCTATLVSLRASCRYKQSCVGLQGGYKPKGPYTCRAMLPDALVYNALLGMSTWTQALTMYTMAHLLQLHHIVQKDIAEYIAVGLIMAYLALWWSVDVFLTLSVSSLVVTPYIITACLFAMSLVKNLNLQNLHCITSATFLCVSGLLLFLKLCAVCHRRCSNKFSSNDKYILHIEGRNGLPAVNGTLTNKDTKPSSTSHDPSIDTNKSKSHTNDSPPLPNGELSRKPPLMLPKTADHQEEQHMVNSTNIIQPSESCTPTSIIKLSNGIQNGIPQRPKSLPLQFVLPQTTEELGDGFITDIEGGMGVTTVKAITLPRIPTSQNGEVPGQGVIVHRIRL